ncbi:MAG: DUF2726 domain-containing protein [Alphaproteobacteria bacterium]|nr:DUF2726 domain-containing protein [Alphaproteobacteria bacterium]
MENTITTLVQKLIPNGGFVMIWSIVSVLISLFLILCFLAWLSDKQREYIGKFYRPKKVLSEAESTFFNLLKEGCGDKFFIFPHVSMKALIETNHLDVWAPINLKRVDFVICDRDTNIICVVELENADNPKRHKRREKLLHSAGINVLKYKTDESLTSSKIYEDISSFVKG